MKELISELPPAAVSKGRMPVEDQDFLDLEDDFEDDEDFDDVRENVKPEGGAGDSGAATTAEKSRLQQNSSRSPVRQSNSSKFGDAARSTARPIKAAIVRKHPARTDPGVMPASGKGGGLPVAEGKTRIGDTKTRGIAEMAAAKALPDPSVENGIEISEAAQARIQELDRALQTSRDEQKKLKEQIEKCRSHIKLFQEDVAGYKRDIERRNQRIEEHENAIEQLKNNSEAVVQDCERHIDLLQNKLTSLNAELNQVSNERDLWAGKHDEVRDDYLRLESELRGLQNKLNELNSKWQAKWEQDNGHFHQEANRYRDALHTAHKEKVERDEENAELRRQVLELKHSISTSTRMESVITDNMVRDSVSTLGHHLQNWTINNFRKAKIDINQLPEEVKEILSRAVPAYKTLIPTSKLNVIQSVITQVLMEEIFDNYFFGLHDDRIEQIRSMEAYLTEITGSPASPNHWRSLTLTILRHSPALKTTTDSHLATLTSHISSLLTALTSLPATDVRDKSLSSILEECVELARLFRAQRARVSFFAPAAAPLGGGEDDEGDCWDSRGMEDVSGEDEDGLIGRRVGCVTFPGVVKEGDEGGDNVHLRNIIVKAKVLCLSE